MPAHPFLPSQMFFHRNIIRVGSPDEQDMRSIGRLKGRRSSWLNKVCSSLGRRNFFPTCFFTVMNTTSSALIQTGVWDLLSHPALQAILGVLVLMAITLIAYRALAKLRGSTKEDGQLADLLQKNFEEMRSEGDISEAEFRKISASLDGVASSRNVRRES
jgi:hypothetical protein